MITPKLVDFELLKPKPKPTIIIPLKTPAQIKSDFSMYVNILFIIIILIFCLVLYYRMQDKEEIVAKQNESILNLYKYVDQGLVHDKESIK